MKPNKSMFFMLLLTLVCSAGMAQKTDNRPQLFAAYPKSLPLDAALISNTLTYKEGTTVSVVLSPDFTFTGTVISNKNKYDNLQTVMIRAADNQTVFQVSRISNSDKTILYAGRIINTNAADGYEIKNKDGLYSLQKFETARILQPCTL